MIRALEASLLPQPPAPHAFLLPDGCSHTRESGSECRAAVPESECPLPAPHTTQLSHDGCQRQWWGKLWGLEHLCVQNTVLANHSSFPQMLVTPHCLLYGPRSLALHSRPSHPAQGLCTEVHQDYLAVTGPCSLCSSQALRTHFSPISLPTIPQAPRGLSCSL